MIESFTMTYQLVDKRTKQKQMNDLVNVIKSGMDPLTKRIFVVENGKKRCYSVTRKGAGPLKTKFGEFLRCKDFESQTNELLIITSSRVEIKLVIDRNKNG